MEKVAMTTPLQSLVASGTKLWLDSVDPDEVERNRAWGATGATSNPIIVADLIKTGRFDEHLDRLHAARASTTTTIAWQLTDLLVRQAQEVFLPVWEADARRRRLRQLRAGPAAGRPGLQRCPSRSGRERYIELGKKWSAGHTQPHDQGARPRPAAWRPWRSWPRPA